MAGLFSTYKTDEAAEINGIEYPTAGAVFIVARSGKNNVAYRKAFDKAAAPHRRAMAAGKLSNEIAESMLLDLFTSHLLKGWRDVTADTAEAAELFGVNVGTAVPFNKSNATKLMLALPDLYEELSAVASNQALYVEEKREDEAKNL